MGRMLLFALVSAACLVFSEAAGGAESATLESSSPAASVPSPEESRLNLIAWEELRQAMVNRYANRDLAGVEWRAALSEPSPSGLPAMSTRDWVKAAAAALAATGDPGIRLEYEGSTVYPVTREPAVDWNDAVILKTFPDIRHINRVFTFGFTVNAVGYLSIDSFDAAAEPDFQDLLGLIALLRNTRGLVVDLRGNAGGAESLGARLAAYFTDRRVTYATVLIRDAAAAGGWRAPLERRLEPSSIGACYNHPVAVLVGRRTGDGAEALALMFRACGVPLVGAPTAGRWGNPQPIKLANGVTVYLASWQVKLPDGSILHAMGVQPDVLVDPGPDAFGTADPVLERALEMVR